MALRSNALLLLALAWLLPAFEAKAKPKSKADAKDTKSKGSAQCEKGVFDSMSKDAVIPLCDAHYPDVKTSKNNWLVLFYNNNEDDKFHRDPLNRVALDLGNEPVEKSKANKLPKKKQRQRIKDLAEKWSFQANIPKKGLEDKGKDALLKVGAVCCDCGEEPALCKSKGLGLRLIKVGYADATMDAGVDEKLDSEKAIHFVMGQLGFIKGVDPSEAAQAESTPAAAEVTETKEALTERLQKLTDEKKKAALDEDYEKAAQLKGEIKTVEEKIKSAPTAAEAAGDSGSAISKKLDAAKAEKDKAVAAEDFKRASQLKKEIAALEEQLKSTPKVDMKELRAKLDYLLAEKKQAIADEDYKKASQLKKEISAIEAQIGKTEL